MACCIIAGCSGTVDVAVAVVVVVVLKSLAATVGFSVVVVLLASTRIFLKYILRISTLVLVQLATNLIVS